VSSESVVVVVVCISRSSRVVASSKISIKNVLLTSTKLKLEKKMN